MQLLMGQLYGSTSSAGWALHQGSGDRYFDTVVQFQSPFPAPPLVQVTLSAIDSDKNENLRVDVLPFNITSQQFTLRVHDWIAYYP
jgi:hypothetical protein